MTRELLLGASPLEILLLLPLVVMVAGAFHRRPTVSAVLTLLGLGAGFATLFVAWPQAPVPLGPLLTIDRFALFGLGLLLLGGAAVVLLARDYLQAQGERADHFHALLGFALAGMGVAVASVHFASFFLGLETLTVSLYGLVGFTRRRRAALESGLKYLVLAATASAFLLFGIALLYALSGTLSFAELGPRLGVGQHGAVGTVAPVALLGLGMVLVGFAFKLALVPFQMVFPDVYQGAPPPAAAWLSTGSKGAVLLVLLRLLTTSGLGQLPTLLQALAGLAALTMTVGNLLALRQGSVRRLLAYSSIAHLGYLLLGLLAYRQGGGAAIAFYLPIYFATVLGAFGALAVLSAEGREVDRIEDLRGLYRRQPLVAGVLAVALLSLVGIPLTGGFFAKLYVFNAAFDAGHGWLVVLAVLNSGLSGYYYLRLLTLLFAAEPPPAVAVPLARLRPWGALTLVLLTGVVLLSGVWPGPLARLAEAATAGLGR